VAEPPPDKVFTAPSGFHELPESVETWKVTVPVGVAPAPETVTLAVTEVPITTGLGGVKVGAGTVGLAWLTVMDRAKPEELR
jgi:hypothetical protein